mgnify:CR=1 FL=1
MAKSWVMHSGQFMMQANTDMTAMEGYMQITRAVTCAFMQIISENISLSHGIIFQASEQFKMSHLKKPWDVNTLHGANPYQGIISRQAEIR